MSEAAPPPPEQVVTQMIFGKWVAMALSVAARLRLADALAAGPKAVGDLAAETRTHAPSLYRVLRALASVGVFAEDAGGRFRQTPLSEVLRSSVPGSMRAVADYCGADWSWRPWGHLLDSVRTGRTAFDEVFGEQAFEYLAKHPAESAVFNEGMTGFSMQASPAVAEAYDFSPFGTIVDVGGGHGHLLCTILAKYPASNGVVFDAPHVVEGAKPRIAEAGLADRCRAEGGDFFRAVPAGDAYVMKHILHDWPDDKAGVILRNCRAAAKPGAKLLYRIGLNPYHEGAPHGRDSDEAPAGRAAPDRQPSAGRVPGLPPPGREGPVARRLAPAPGRPPPHPGPGGRGRRAVSDHRPGRPPPLERSRPGRADRPPQGQPVRAQAGPRTAGRAAGRPGKAAAGRRGVDRAEGGPVRGRPVGRAGLPPDRVGLAAGPGLHPPGPSPVPPPGGRPGDPGPVEKNFRRRVARLRRAHPGKAVEVWAEDEARLGLKPIARRIWSRKGQRPRSGGRTRYDWLYVYGFAHPRTGRTFAVIRPRVNADRMGEALAAFAAHADPAGGKVLVVLVDNAGWHVAKRLVVPPNVVLHFLPPCTPELQPAEPLWPLVREAVVNRSIGRIDRLRAILRVRLAYLAGHPEVVQPVIGFRWAARLEQ